MKDVGSKGHRIVSGAADNVALEGFGLGSSKPGIASGIHSRAAQYAASIGAATIDLVSRDNGLTR